MHLYGESGVVCMNNPGSGVQTAKIQKPVIDLILDALEDIENGTLTIIFQDENIIQINKYEKFAAAG